MAAEGRFNFEATKSGSLLWAVVSGMSGILLADTQLVESINSIIKLISARCSKIDIASLSSRVILKKASAFTREGLGTKSEEDVGIKRWSVVRSRALPASVRK